MTLWTQIKNKSIFCAVTALLLLINGCANVYIPQDNQEQPTTLLSDEVADQSVEANVEEALEVDIVYGNFSEDALSRIILAEMAGQRGLNQEALDGYVSLARETHDLGIIKRASRIAAYSLDVAIAVEMGGLWLEQEPDSIEAHQSMAFQYVRQGRYDLALEHFSALLALGYDVDFRVISSSLDDASGSFSLIIDSLIADLEALQTQYPDNNSLRLVLATLFEQNNQVEESYQQVVILAKAMEDAPEIVILEVQLLEQLGRPEQANQRLEESLETNPEHKQLRFLYGRKLVDERRYNEAMEQFSLIVENDPEDFNMLYSLALISMEVNRFNDAKGYLQRLVDHNQRSDDAHYYLAYISAQEDDPEQAIEHYLQVEAGANFLPAQRNVTELMVRQGRYAQASSRLQTIRFRNPDYNIALMTMEANVLMEQNLLEDARVFLNNAVGAFPNDMQLLFVRSVLSADLNDLALMEQDLRKIILLNPTNPTAYNSLGYTLADRTDRYEEAYELIKQAISLSPDDPAIMDSLGWVQYRLGLYEEAKISLEKAFELYPDHEVAAHLGEVLWALGSRREANQIWQSALDLRPDSEFILETMNRLRMSSPSTAE